MEIEQKTIIKKHRESSFTQSFVSSTGLQIPFAENAQKIDTKKQRKECLEKFPKVFFEFIFFVSTFSFFLLLGVKRRRHCEYVCGEEFLPSSISIPTATAVQKHLRFENN